MVAAGLDYLVSHSRTANTHPHLMQGFAAGNPGGHTGTQLLERARQIASNWYRRRNKSPRSDTAGQVDALFVAIVVRRRSG